MIKGATQLIAGIPGKYLDPFRLAESQPTEFSGYAVIAYNTDRRVWDLLFLRGRAITESARIDEHQRRAVEPKDVEDRFADTGLRERSRVYLFEAPVTLLDPFVRTLRAVPVLKVQVDPLSREQLIRLIKNAQERPLIAERWVIQPALPLFEFLEIKSPDQHIEFHVRFRKGVLLLYRPDAPRETGPQLHLDLEQKNAGAGNPPRRATVLVEFTRKLGVEAAACLRKKGEGLLPLEPDGTLFDKIPALLSAAGPFRRPRLRRAVKEMLGELYSERFEQLKEEGLVERAELCYRQLKG